MPRAELLEIRFWKHVQKTDQCWNWTSTKLPAGYGMIKADRSRKNLYAHRVSWEIHNGSIPDGLFVLHDCDNPSCVRPDHLFLGTQLDNMQDCVSKGRLSGCIEVSWHGEDNPRAKLTSDTAREIRLSAASLSSLAKTFGVSKGTIWKVRSGYTWNEDAHYVG